MAMLRAAEIAAHRALLAWQRGDGEAVLAFTERSAEWLKRFDAQESDRAEAKAVLVYYGNVARQYMNLERFDQAVDHCRRGSDLAKSFDRPLLRADCLNIVALALRYQGDLDGALNAARESVRLLEPSTRWVSHRR